MSISVGSPKRGVTRPVPLRKRGSGLDNFAEFVAMISGRKGQDWALRDLSAARW
ncbi:hypothetical protein FHS81_002209 [Pseudochelatococcus contaminans]|uniref:Uncharacterized protein n=1 Tax=Pseudochelatococcus contaminans TaxID=1538103 RepID=A0A7W5Z4M3_9HYPH|nr:hypothetical protein [Pseudochelatococcus contaminans]